ncbi:MAG: anthranilate phosphoribosyltransferase [Candidatus Omnitrophica bacterium]|nr:anthranilate phosphoribosyltransferase [Candidatus Omnitrophota bacterium]
MIREALHRLAEGKSLSYEKTREVFEEIFEKRASAAQIAAFLFGLKRKGETEQEIAAAAAVVRSKARKILIRDNLVEIDTEDEFLVDTCGTGGSGVAKANISTGVAFVVSAAGVRVAKHGNRAMSSGCGSADVLEALGVDVNVPPEIMADAIRATGIGFLYAPLYHPALKEVAGIRREMGIRTIFNILGPLCNPAQATHQLLGVYRKDLVPVMARVLRRLGTKNALIVWSEDLKDEVSLSRPTYAALLRNKRVRQFLIRPGDFKLKRMRKVPPAVNDVRTSARLLREVFRGEHNPARDLILANTAACFLMMGKVKELKAGVDMAAELIDSGAAGKKLKELKIFVADHA